MKKKYRVLFLAIILIMNIFSGMSVSALQENAPSNNIIPKPLSYEKRDGNFKLNKDTMIYFQGRDEDESRDLLNICTYMKMKVMLPTGFDLNIMRGNNPSENSIFLTTISGDENLGIEGYNLEVTEDKITATAYTPEGVFRAVQTLIQMLPSEIEEKKLVEDVEWIIPGAIINDMPQNSYRGFMIDVARHFFDIDTIKKQIDYASQYKINRLHLHLSDDQGWRLEIKKYPDLTRIGGSTEVGGGKGGYYTQEQFKELVSYAKERYIEIIPEFDMPGHSNAALASYGFLNPDGKKKPLYTGIEVGFSSFMTRDEKTYEFIDNVFKEVAEISLSKYIHIGGDEALSTKKEDYDYFVGRVAKIAEKYGKTPIGWDPIDTSPEINSRVILENWKDSNEAAREKGMKMIIAIASKTYLDMKYNKETPYGLDWAGYIPIETAYNWDLTDYAPEDLILGIESPLWTETISTVDEMEYMIYPRLLGYAEIGWTPKNLRNFDEYKERLKAQGERLKIEGINFYDDKEIFN